MIGMEADWPMMRCSYCGHPLCRWSCRDYGYLVIQCPMCLRRLIFKWDIDLGEIFDCDTFVTHYRIGRADDFKDNIRIEEMPANKGKL